MRQLLLPVVLMSAGWGVTVPASFAAASVCEGGAGSAARSLPVAAWAERHLEEGLAPAAGPVLGTAPDEALSVQAVLLRRQIQGCTPLAAGAEAYVPKTEHDNTPWRFHMDAGKRLTAAEFDAWMKARGVRVVGQRPDNAAAPEQTERVGQ